MATLESYGVTTRTESEEETLDMSNASKKERSLGVVLERESGRSENGERGVGWIVKKRSEIENAS